MNKFFRIIILSLFFSFVTPFAVAGIASDVSLVSVNLNGTTDDYADSHLNAVSADGRLILFHSNARNLVDDNIYGGLFMRDVETGLTERISDLRLTQFDTAMSGDGQFVVFLTNSGFIVDRVTGLTDQLNIPAVYLRSPRLPAMSADGRFITYTSYLKNLLPGGREYSTYIMVHDRNAGTTERVGVPSSGDQLNQGSTTPSISDDGRFLAFTSYATNLVLGDTNDFPDVFVHDRQTNITERVSVASNGTQGNEGSYQPKISANGRFVAFWSSASNLVADDTNGEQDFLKGRDVFVHDRETGLTERVSVSSTGAQFDRSSLTPSISADGRFVAFESSYEILVHDRETDVTESAVVGSGANISADGRFVTFRSTYINPVDGSNKNELDVFITKNPHLDSDRNLISIEMLINGKAREIPEDSAQLLTGTLYERNYRVTNLSPDRLTGMQIFEDGKLVCDMYTLNPGQTKQRSRCAVVRTVPSGSVRFTPIQSIVLNKDNGATKTLKGFTPVYITGIDNASSELRLTHQMNKINADSESQAPILDSSQASVSFKIENTGDIELYRVKTYHDPARPVNSGWDQQCLIGTLKPGQIRYCKRDINLSSSGLNKAWGWAQGKRSYVSHGGAVNASNPTYFIVP